MLKQAIPYELRWETYKLFEKMAFQLDQFASTSTLNQNWKKEFGLY